MPCKRILIKLSGEILLGDEKFGIDEHACLKLAETLKNILKSGYQVGVVIGGGNIFRGVHLNRLGIARTPADQMGMLATVINGLALQQALEKLEISAQLLSALECPKVAETYNWKKANEYLKAGSPIIFVGGTGSPYFTTDTAAALRASELNVDILLKATKVDGVYTEDPQKNLEAKKYSSLSYTQYLAEKLAVMDATSVALCMNSKVPIFVFCMDRLGKIPIEELLRDPKKHGTLIYE